MWLGYTHVHRHASVSADGQIRCRPAGSIDAEDPVRHQHLSRFSAAMINCCFIFPAELLLLASAQLAALDAGNNVRCARMLDGQMMTFAVIRLLPHQTYACLLTSAAWPFVVQTSKRLRSPHHSDTIKIWLRNRRFIEMCAYCSKLAR